MTQEVFSLTPKQDGALDMLGCFLHFMLFGGSRSGKTFLCVLIIVRRALAAPGSRHAILRFRFNHVKASVVHDTFPKVMGLVYPDVAYKIDKTDWFAEFPNGAQIWFGGLDDKERTEKILGQEYATIYLNECSQIPLSSRNLAVTRLAQKINRVDGQMLRLMMLYDCNPPSVAHWTYKLFIQKINPDSKQPLPNAEQFGSVQLNPTDNLDNLPDTYIETLQSLPERLRQRFERGEFSPANENALWSLEIIEANRYEKALPDMSRVVVAVDPSGVSSEESDGDPVGIVVCGLGVDGYAYVLEDLTLKASPSKWGRVAVTAYERHRADRIVGEDNYGGAMVEHVIKTADLRAPYRAVKATRGKVVRAEPISALSEQGKIRFAGNFAELEDELCAFTTTGYQGDESPNRADAFVWALTELFPSVLTKTKQVDYRGQHTARGFMG